MSDAGCVKTVYDSETLARNAATLHRMACPACTTMNHYRCGDHYHIGHDDPRAGEACKMTPDRPTRPPQGPRAPRQHYTGRRKRP